MKHQEIQEEFARQAPAFEDSRYAFGKPEVLAWMAQHSPTAPNDIVLEVAAGTGWFARTLAPGVRAVLATDITVEMLAAGKRAAQASGLTNIVFQEADVEHLPFLDNSFDRVVCRLALHHLDEPTVSISEMVRVCQPSGSITVIDMVVPDGAAADVFNDLERRRDPTHTRALTRAELHDIMTATGTRIAHTASFDNHIIASRWIAQTGTSPEVAAGITAQLEEDIAGGPSTGFEPRYGDDELEFIHRWELIVAEIDD